MKQETAAVFAERLAAHVIDGAPLTFVAALVENDRSQSIAAVLAYLEDRIASHRKGVSMRDARDLAVDELLRKYAAQLPAAPEVSRLPVDHEPFSPMECCGRDRDKDGGPNPHCECAAPARRPEVST